MLFDSDLRYGLEFDCNSQASLVRGARLLIDFNDFEIVYNLLICVAGVTLASVKGTI